MLLLVWAWPRLRANRSVAGAMATGLLVRLCWVIAIAGPQRGPMAEAGTTLATARQIAAGSSPALAGHATAFFAPGFPTLVAPLVAFADTAGWNPVLLVALLNALIGTATIAGVAVLAGQWLGKRASVPAAWILALGPGPVFLTAVPHAATLFCGLAVGVMVAATTVTRARWSVTRRRIAWVMIGIGIGFACLVSIAGLFLLAAPLLARRDAPPADRSALGSILPVMAAVLLTVAPWTVRNGLATGIWTPFSTGVAGTICIGQAAGSDGLAGVRSVEGHPDCYRSTFLRRGLSGRQLPPASATGPTDEAAWYRSTLAAAVRRPLTHPADAAQRTVRKLVSQLSVDPSLTAVVDTSTDLPLTRRTIDALSNAAQGWNSAVVVLAALAVALSRRARRAPLLWGVGPITAMAVTIGAAATPIGTASFVIATALAGSFVSAVGARSEGADPESL